MEKRIKDIIIILCSVGIVITLLTMWIVSQQPTDISNMKIITKFK